MMLALLPNPTIKEAAAAAGVNESTVWRLMQRDDFQNRFREAQGKVFNGALSDTSASAGSGKNGDGWKRKNARGRDKRGRAK
jgi:hypothetical protein